MRVVNQGIHLWRKRPSFSKVIEKVDLEVPEVMNPMWLGRTNLIFDNPRALDKKSLHNMKQEESAVKIVMQIMQENIPTMQVIELTLIKPAN